LCSLRSGIADVGHQLKGIQARIEVSSFEEVEQSSDIVLALTKCEFS
jgi:hypothetical protein